MAENKIAKNIIKPIATLAVLVVLSGCAVSSNVKRDFDCKVEKGSKCEKIRVSDKKSQKRLESFMNPVASGAVKEAECSCGIKREYKVKYAPYIDEDGNYHKESEVIYRGEYQ